MSHAAYRRFWLIVFVLCLAPSGFAQNQPPRPVTTATTVEELAAALVAARTEEERTALLGAKKELQTPALVRALIIQGGQLRSQRFSSPENARHALAIFQLAQRLAERMGDKGNTAWALFSLGDVYHNQGDQSFALEHYQQSLALYEAIGAQPVMAFVMLNIGHSYSAQGDFGSALKYYNKSREFYEPFYNWAAIATAQSYVGDAYRLQKNYDAALEAYRKALIILEASAYKTGIDRVLNNLALVYTEQGKVSLASEARQRSKTISEELNQASQKAAANAGAVSKLADRLMAAETDEEHNALLEAEKKLVTRELSSLIFTRAGQLGQQNNYTKAISSYRLAARIAELVGDRITAANALTFIGGIYSSQRNNRPAQEYYQQSLALWEKMGIPVGVAQMLYRLGFTYNIQQNYGLALWHYRKARAIAEAAESTEMANRVLLSMGNTYTRLGQYDRAEECLKQTVAHAAAVGSKPGVAHGYHFFFILYAQQGRLDLARQYAQRSIPLLEEIRDKNTAAHMKGDLADLDRRQGNYAAAIENYQQSIAELEASANRNQLIPPLRGLAETYYRQGNYQQALQLTERAAALSRPLGYWYSSSVLPTVAGKIHRALKQPARARQAFEEAIGIVETMRAQLLGGEQEGQHFFEEKVSPYHEMVALLMAQQQPAAALAYAERAKARMLLDILRNDRTDVVSALTAEEQTQELRLKNDLIQLNVELLLMQQSRSTDPALLTNLQARQQQARQAFEAFQAGLYLAHPELRIKRGQVPVLRSEEIAALLPDSRTALLEFVVTEEQAFLFAITRNDVGHPPGVEVKAYPLAITAKELGARARAFRQQIARRDPEFGAKAREIYDLLLKPAAGQLRGRTSLVIVPDGPLWELPFQILKPSPDRYLLEDHAISYAPSLTVLREMIKARSRTINGGATLLAFGNPALGKETATRATFALMDEKLDPLPEAEVQVNTLARIYGTRQSKVYVGTQAREARAKMEAGNYRILHLATHGVLNDASPMYSYLLLSQTGEQGEGAREDGLLETWELMKLDLNADLVVLSACETARGRVGAGEGVIGLTWALFVAGSPRTVVSQWKVESASTTDLMVEFHRQLRTRTRNPKSSFGAAEALRAAALKMLRGDKFRHPFWWAGFVVVGDGY